MIYLVCFIGLSRIPKIPFYSRGDYSYGIYLYGFPLQQALIQVFPSLHFWPYHLAASVCCATAFAAFSWHTIEKPMLKLRKAFSFARRLEQERQAAN
jgi:peptidoglycan/LPS O-acetylase OafA/YrhL